MPVPASSYNDLIPQPTDQQSVSQNDILLNFGAIKTLIDVDHGDFSTATYGQHNKVSLPVQAVAPVFAAGTNGIFSNLPATPATGVNEVWLNKQTSAGAAYIPMTASILSTNSNPGTNSSGWSYLPSGIIMKWGSGTANGNTAFVFPVAANIPVFTQVVSMQVCTQYLNAADGNLEARLSTWTNLGFNVYGSQRTVVNPAAVSFQYLAIGY